MTRQEKLNKCYLYLSLMGAVKDKKDFATQIGTSYTNLSAAFNGSEKYLSDTLFKKIEKAFPNALADSVSTNSISPSELRVPVIPTEAMGGSLGDFSSSVHLYDCEMVTSPVKGATYAIQVSGDSMSPEYPSGCKVLIKQINEKAFVEWGKVYVLDTDNGAIIKQVRKTEKDGVVECVSLNPAYQSFTVDTQYIKGWYRVLMMMSLK